MAPSTPAGSAPASVAALSMESIVLVFTSGVVALCLFFFFFFCPGMFQLACTWCSASGVGGCSSGGHCPREDTAAGGFVGAGGSPRASSWRSSRSTVCHKEGAFPPGTIDLQHPGRLLRRAATGVLAARRATPVHRHLEARELAAARQHGFTPDGP